MRQKERVFVKEYGKETRVPAPLKANGRPSDDTMRNDDDGFASVQARAVFPKQANVIAVNLLDAKRMQSGKRRRSNEANCFQLLPLQWIFEKMELFPAKQNFWLSDLSHGLDVIFVCRYFYHTQGGLVFCSTFLGSFDHGNPYKCFYEY